MAKVNRWSRKRSPLAETSPTVGGSTLTQTRTVGIPDFHVGARGAPSEWLAASRVLTWSYRSARKFTDDPAARASIADVAEFLATRKGPNGHPMVDALENPKADKCGWYRCALKGAQQFAGRGTTRAWHPTRAEAMYSALFHRRLVDAEQTMVGSTACIRLYKTGTEDNLNWQAPWSPVLGESLFFQVMCEVITDKSEILQERTDHWICRNRHVRLVALWLRVRTTRCMELGDRVVAGWDPLMEMNPYALRVWSTVGNEVAPRRRAVTLGEWLPSGHAEQRAPAPSVARVEEQHDGQEALVDHPSPRGLEPMVQSSLPTMVWAGGASNRWKRSAVDTQCPICLSEYQEGEKLLLLPCLHSAHEECMKRWLTRSARCLVCKSDVQEGVHAALHA